MVIIRANTHSVAPSFSYKQSITSGNESPSEFLLQVAQNLGDLYDINPYIINPIDFNGKCPLSQGCCVLHCHLHLSWRNFSKFAMCWLKL